MKLQYKIQYEGDAGESPIDWMTPQERGVYYAMHHSRYTLPYEVDASTKDYDSWGELAKAVTNKKGELPGYVYKFVRWYEHSGIAVSLVDDDNIGGWDTGCAGVVFGKTLEAIEQEFKTYAQYLEGEVYTVTIEDENGQFIDSLGGIYGYDNAKAEAKEMLASAQIEQDKQDKLAKQAAKEITQAKTLASKHGYILAREI